MKKLQQHMPPAVLDYSTLLITLGAVKIQLFEMFFPNKQVFRNNNNVSPKVH